MAGIAYALAYGPTFPSRRDRVSALKRPAEKGGTETESGASVRPADDAHVCGALGCGETEDLVTAERDGEERVLCRDHARGWPEG